LTRLANVSDLQVISRTSVERYRDSDLSLPAIADSLGVQWIVEGGVSQIEDQVRINAQLIDPQSDSHIWADTYQRALTANDLFAIQGEIAREIADALQSQLSPEEQQRIAGAPTKNLEAYRLYVQGRQTLDQATSKEKLVRAAQYFGRALHNDTTYALAWAGLADVIGYGLNQISRPDTLQIPMVSQMEAAQQALELDSNLAEAHSALGHANFQQHNAPAALRSFQRALELKPSYAEAHSWLASVYNILDRPEQALEHLKLAEQLKPQHAYARHRLFDTYNRLGQHKKALEEVRKQQGINPYPGAKWAEARSLFQLGRYEEAIAIAEERLAKTEDKFERFIMRIYLVRYEAAAGDTAQARAHMNEFKQITFTPEERSRWSFFLAGPYLVFENQDAVIEALQDRSDELEKEIRNGE
jgi:tetratricopeptide (TPR) repeat protein